MTTVEALGWLIGSLLVGLVVGFSSGSRWSMAIAPAASIVGFELARVGAVGPTVDAVQLGSTYGTIALVVGRGLTLPPTLPATVLGGLLGVQLAAWRHRPGTRPLRVVGWASVGLLTVAVVGLGAAFARPASTPAIVGADGLPVPGSVAELTSISLGGTAALLIRGRSTDAPVFLHLAGADPAAPTLARCAPTLRWRMTSWS